MVIPAASPGCRAPWYTAVSLSRYRAEPETGGGPEIQVVELHTDEGLTGKGFASASAAGASGGTAAASRSR